MHCTTSFLFADPISRVLLPLRGRHDQTSPQPSRPPVIYLRRCSHTASSNLPPDIGRATLNCRYTWSCNPQGVLPDDIAAAAVGSYPTFSPLPRRYTGTSGDCSPPLPRHGGYFLLRYYTLTDIEPLTRTVLCVARTFLSPCGQR